MLHRSPIDPNWAPLLINWKRDNTKDKIFIELLLSLVASPARFNGTCKLVLEVSVSHGDSAISHPRDQDYLSLWAR